MSTQSKKLAGKVAVVTGASKGIGAEIAKHLAAEGAAVVVNYSSSRDGADRVVAEISANGGRALAVHANVAKGAEIERLFAEAKEAFGRLDILVNNAGITRDNLLYKMPEDDWDRVIAVHLRGAFLCSRAAQKPMVERKYGRIISLSSTSALGNRGQANYSAAKAGLQGFTRTLAIELGPFGITANAVAPGFIDTDMTRATAQRLGITFDQMSEALSKEIPLRRVGQPSEVASVIAFLASEDASYVSGQIIYVKGGPAGVSM
jgi:3-oxoacyl-[acyl-carrier protein] reductase